MLTNAIALWSRPVFISLRETTQSLLSQSSQGHFGLIFRHCSIIWASSHRGGYLTVSGSPSSHERLSHRVPQSDREVAVCVWKVWKVQKPCFIPYQTDFLHHFNFLSLIIEFSSEQPVPGEFCSHFIFLFPLNVVTCFSSSGYQVQ